MEQDSALARVALVTNRRAAAKRIEQRPARPGQRTATEAATEASTLAQLMVLKRMSVNEMKAKWEALFATPAPNNSRGYPHAMELYAEATSARSSASSLSSSVKSTTSASVVISISDISSSCHCTVAESRSAAPGRPAACNRMKQEGAEASAVSYRRQAVRRKRIAPPPPDRAPRRTARR